MERYAKKSEEQERKKNGKKSKVCLLLVFFYRMMPNSGMFTKFLCTLFITRDINERRGDKGVQRGRRIQSFQHRNCNGNVTEIGNKALWFSSFLIISIHFVLFLFNFTLIGNNDHMFLYYTFDFLFFSQSKAKLEVHYPHYWPPW